MSTPRINPNDPKWTAYILDELDEADRAAVERLLQSSDEARALVEELRVGTAMLGEAMASASTDHLSAGQKAAVRHAADADGSRWFARVPMRWSWGLGAAAAAALVAVVAQVPPAQQGSAVPATRVVALTPGPVAPPVSRQEVSAAQSDSRGPVSTAQQKAAPPMAQAATAAPVLTVDEFSRLNAGGAPTTLTGLVRDAQGAVVPGVTVTAVNPASNTMTSTVTDGAGRYTLENIEPGQSYRVTATLHGFQGRSLDLRAAANANPQQDFTLMVVRPSETLTVAQGPVVDLQAARRELIVPSSAGGGSGGGRSSAGVPGGVAGGVVGALPQALAAPPPHAAAGGASTSFFPGRSDVVSFPRPSHGTESYARVAENAFVRAAQEPLATFSIDVDTASYSNVRRFLNQNQLPPVDAVRIEELVNYFTYDYARPSGSHPIGASLEVADAPWNSRHHLVRIGIKARAIDPRQRPASNLVFLIDVSGSMNTPQKLPLVKSGLKMLVDQLGENDLVSIVVYASATGLVLPPTSGERKHTIAQAIDNLQAGGSTNGGAGIQLAYRQATANFIRGGVNRVILVTDGDFNVGLTSQAELTALIEDRARSGVFLSVLGFGMGNLKDSTMERLADMGNGHYAYIDTLNEARKVLVEELSNTLVTVAKDVKIQVDFNPGKVEAYRLIGYENRLLRPEDFNDDLKDAGEMGAGHTVTALFEVVPRGGAVPGPSVDPSVFQKVPRDTQPPASSSNDMLVLRVRYKLPDASDSTRMDVPLPDRRRAFTDASPDFRFAASVAGFGMILKNSPYRGEATLPWVLDTATASRGQDRTGYRDEFISLVQRALALRGERYH